jgi:hypothetical protein
MDMTQRYTSTTDHSAQPKKRIRGRPFQPGNCGRPRGAKNRTTRLIEELVGNEAENLTRKAIQRALTGDVRCLQFLLERLLPKRNGRPIDLSITAVNSAHDVVNAMATVTTGVSDGTLTADEAAQLANFLSSYVKILETHDLAARLEALETQMRKDNK